MINRLRKFFATDTSSLEARLQEAQENHSTLARSFTGLLQKNEKLERDNRALLHAITQLEDNSRRLASLLLSLSQASLKTKRETEDAIGYILTKLERIEAHNNSKADVVEETADDKA